MKRESETKTSYGAKSLARVRAERDTLQRRAEKNLAKLRAIEAEQIKLEQKADQNEALLMTKAARARVREASRRNGQLFAWGTLVERELLSGRLDANQWRSWLTKVFADNPAELGRATLGLEMRGGVDSLPRNDRQVWRLRWGVAVERQLESGEIIPEALAARVVRTLDKLDHRRGLEGIERVAGRRVEIGSSPLVATDTKAPPNDIQSAHSDSTSVPGDSGPTAVVLPSAASKLFAPVPIGRLARLAIEGGIWPIDKMKRLAESLAPADHARVIRGIDTKSGSLTRLEIALYEGSLEAMISDWVREGIWNKERTEQLVNKLRARGAIA